ncbi:MAG TPA: MaoC family dehydratase [Caulobacterales bacterium]|nr:MaoC family dehydratase [Caulobacterales bacterium]
MREIALSDLPAHVGEELGVSDWLDITQERVNRFADATGDFQWIHVDVERATKELGGPIAHGYLVLSLIPFMARNIVTYTGVARGINYGSNKVRFTNMVPVGSRIRLRLKLLAVEERGGCSQITSECAVEIEDETRPACVAETVALLYPA